MDPFQGLQDNTRGASSNCYCRIEAVIVSKQLKLEDVVEPFEQNIAAADVVVVVDGIYEPRAVECSNETKEFSSELSFQFSAFAATTAEDESKLGQVVAETYDGLVVEYCDPQLRCDISLELVTFSRVSNPGRLNNRIVYQTKQQCLIN
jgi:hypothetical protein